MLARRPLEAGSQARPRHEDTRPVAPLMQAIEDIVGDTETDLALDSDRRAKTIDRLGLRRPPNAFGGPDPQSAAAPRVLGEKIEHGRAAAARQHDRRRTARGPVFDLARRDLRESPFPRAAVVDGAIDMAITSTSLVIDVQPVLKDHGRRRARYAIG